jgi:hypothetical protein
MNILEAFGIKHASRLQFKNKATGAYDLWLPWCNSITLDVTSDEITALQQGEEAISWSGAKKGTLTISTQVVNMGILALMLGSSGIQTKDINIFKREVFTLTSADITAGTLTLTDTPNTGTLGVATLLKDNASYDKVFTVVDGATVPAPATGQASLSNKVITFNSADITVGAKIACMYFVNKTAQKVFSVSTTSDSPSYEVYGDVIAKALSDKSRTFMQLQIHDATVQQSIKLDLSATQASTFEIKMKVVGDSSMLDANGEPTMLSLAPVA